MRRARILAAILAGLLSSSFAQISDTYEDRLHGFRVKLPEGWRVSIIGGLPVFSKQHCYIAVGAVAHEGSLKTVAQQLIRDLKRIQLGQPRLAYRTIPQGVQVVGEGLEFPYALDPLAVLRMESLPNRYNLVGVLLKGQKVALAVLFFFPEETPASIRKEMGELVRTLEFLPASKRVKWKAVTLHDSYLGMPMAVVHVPEDCSVQSSPIRQGAKYIFRYEVKRDDFFYRLDALDILTSLVGVGGTSTLTYNGSSVPLEGAVVIRTPEEAEQAILALWQAETGRQWTVKDRRVRQEKTQPPPRPLPVPGEAKAWNIAFIAESEALERVAFVNLSTFTAIQYDPLVSSGSHQATFTISVAQYPKQKREAFLGIVGGIMTSVQGNPKWAVAAFEEFTRTNIEINERLRQKLEEQREERSRMARAWTNALSDQTYIRDPETGEVFKVHKRVWDVNNFWRDPIFGDIIGTIGKDTKLGEILREKGWKVMDESLSGFP